MPRSVHTVALDFGATSGRVILGRWDGKRLALQEVHRFPNAFRSLGGHDYWDVGTLWQEVQAGLQHAVAALPRGDDRLEPAPLKRQGQRTLYLVTSPHAA